MWRFGTAACLLPCIALQANTTQAAPGPEVDAGVTRLGFRVVRKGVCQAGSLFATLSGGNDNTATNLPACVGECDKDTQCTAGLKCFQRANTELVPGYLLTAKSGNIFRVGIFLDFVRLTTRTIHPHDAYVTCREPNEIELTPRLGWN